MTWAEFHGLFMTKYFPATARHEKGPRVPRPEAVNNDSDGVRDQIH